MHQVIYWKLPCSNFGYFDSYWEVLQILIKIVLLAEEIVSYFSIKIVWRNEVCVVVLILMR